MSIIPVNRPPAPRTPVVDARYVSDSVLRDLNTLLKHGSNVGVGNLYLSVLYRPGEDRSPSPDALFLWEALPYVLGHLFDIPAELMAVDAFPKPYLDQHVSYRDRTTWARGMYVHLVVMGYALGGTRTNPPYEPHIKLATHFYRPQGMQQMQILIQMAQEYQRIRKLIEEREARKPPPIELPPPQIDEAEVRSLIGGMTAHGLSADVVRQEVVATIVAARQGTSRRPTTQDDLFRR